MAAFGNCVDQMPAAAANIEFYLRQKWETFPDFLRCHLARAAELPARADYFTGPTWLQCQPAARAQLCDKLPGVITWAHAVMVEVRTVKPELAQVA